MNVISTSISRVSIHNQGEGTEWIAQTIVAKRQIKEISKLGIF